MCSSSEHYSARDAEILIRCVWKGAARRCRGHRSVPQRLCRWPAHVCVLGRLAVRTDLRVSAMPKGVLQGSMFFKHMAVSHLSPKRKFIRYGPNQEGHLKSGLVAFMLKIESLMTVWSRPKSCKPTNEKVPYSFLIGNSTVRSPLPFIYC